MACIVGGTLPVSSLIIDTITVGVAGGCVVAAASASNTGGDDNGGGDDDGGGDDGGVGMSLLLLLSLLSLLLLLLDSSIALNLKLYGETASCVWKALDALQGEEQWKWGWLGTVMLMQTASEYGCALQLLGCPLPAKLGK